MVQRTPLARGVSAAPGCRGGATFPFPAAPFAARILAHRGTVLARYVLQPRYRRTAMDPVIPLADLQPIYSVAEVDRALEDSAARRNESLKGWYDRMRDLGGSRYIVKPSRTEAVDELYDASPNFVDVIDD